MTHDAMVAPADSEIRRLVVSAKDTSCPGIARIVLKDSSDGELPKWTPGSHVELRLPGGLVRQYSLCGRAEDRDEWVLGVRHDETGRGGSTYVHETLSVGDTIEVAGPRNHFELHDSNSYAFIAGGIGITPIIPMIEHVEARGDDWTLTYLGRSRTCMLNVEQLATDYPGKVTVLPEDEGQQPPITDLISGTSAGTLIYTCGPTPMIDAAVAAADEQGRSSDLFFERFAPLEIDESENSSFDVEFALSGITRRVTEEQTILGVAREENIAVSFSCSEGTCGTCETPVLAGAVDHRDVVLTPEEQEESATMMICISRAKGPKLVLEL